MIKGHGGNLEEAARLSGRPAKSIVDFSASVNRSIDLGLFQSWLAESATALNHYPDPEYSELKEKIARRYGLAGDSIILGNGATELLYLAPRALKIRDGLVLAPSYADYADALTFAGAKVARLLLKHQNGFAYDYESVSHEVRKGRDMVIIGNPNNPTGSTVALEAIRELMETHTRTTFVVDESFADFSPSVSILPTLPPNAIVLRSFTKFFGIPGLRAGFAVAQADVIRKLAAVKEPWTLNSVAEHVCRRLLDGGVDEGLIRNETQEGRESLFKALSACKGLMLYPSPANFLLAHISSKTMTAAELRTRLLKDDGLLIRDCGNFEGLDPYWFRVAVRGRADNEKLASAIGAALCGR
ncbi:MAG: threonine-phosphate decarboxylase [Nitrospinae bacterium]|nr:threonine-phosphate decarboxylase [Nitrospinota bacterium]